MSKFKYLKISNLLWGTNTITKDDLIRLKDRGYDFIVELDEMKYFDAETNTWADIEGEAQ